MWKRLIEINAFSFICGWKCEKKSQMNEFSKAHRWDECDKCQFSSFYYLLAS